MKSLLLVLTLTFYGYVIDVHAQQAERTIKGMVMTEFREPVPFASVTLKDKEVGTLTDLDGKFQIAIPNDCQYLVIAFVGHPTEEVNIEGKDSITVIMKSGVVLGAVEVMDYVVPPVEKDATTQGSIKTAEQLRHLPVKSINGIAATTAGLSVVNGVDVSIRGSRSDATSYHMDAVEIIKGLEVSADDLMSTTPVKPTSTTTRYPEVRNRYSAGQLTAGEINDFGKWVLWNDKSQQELTAFRNEWNIYPSQRYMVIVQNKMGIPIVGQPVHLLDEKKNTVWSAKTDNTGKAELWSNMFEENYKGGHAFSILTDIQGKEYRVEKAQRFEQGVNHLTVKSDCQVSNVVDAMFVVDATGSMGDEIAYLQAELTDVMQKVIQQNPDITYNLGSVFYRDHGDAYVTRTSDFSSDISKTIHFIQNQTAEGGGDYPEAVDEGLEMAVRNMNWSPDARTKLLFVVLDASPHKKVENLKRIREITLEAAAAGIRIIPLAASGIDKSTEYVMRSIALGTNGTYVFLSNHSGIGNPHLEPTTDKYDVEKLNDLIIRLFDQYTAVVSCTEDPGQFAQVESDTLVIQSAQDFAKGSGDDMVPPDVEILPEPISCKYYPNPTTGPLNIEVNGSIQELFLCDVAGKLLHRFEVNEDEMLEVDISQYPVGTYRILYFESPDVPRSGTVVLVR
jgi:hypothetical protein